MEWTLKEILKELLFITRYIKNHKLDPELRKIEERIEKLLLDNR